MEASSEVSSQNVAGSELQTDTVLHSATPQGSLPRNNLTSVNNTQELSVEHKDPGPGHASPPAVSGTSGHDFDAESLALFSNISREIDQENRNGRLEWVFGVGWSHRFATELVPSATPLRVIATVIRLAKEKHAMSLLEFLCNTLANAVRCHDEWRVLFGECGIVEACLDVMQMEEAEPSKDTGSIYVRAVRLLANCCGDPCGNGSASANRAQVIARISVRHILTMMRVPTQQTEAVSLVYNVGAYDEAFRNMAIEAGLLPALWDVLRVLAQPVFSDLRTLGFVCEMLTWSPGEVDATSGGDPFRIFFEISRRELCCEHVEVLIDTTSFILERYGLPKDSTTFVDLLNFISSTCLSEANLPSGGTSLKKRFFGEDETLLEEARKTLITQLGVLSGGSTTALQWPAASPPFTTLLNWLRSSHFQLRICALTVLGNLAYQSESLNEGLAQADLGQTLCVILKTEKNGLVLKTALGAVQRFARDVQHRDYLGQSNTMTAIAPGWAQGTNLPLQTAALSATRHLLSGSLENINRFLTEHVSPEKSLLDTLLETFQHSEVFETRLDIAWTLERMWRSIYSHPDVRKMSEVENEGGTGKAMATDLVKEIIPDVFREHPRVTEPFQTILVSGDQDRIIAATYTLSMILTSKAGQEAVYNTLCLGEGPAVILTTLEYAGNPKAQRNARTLVQQLKGCFAADIGRSSVLNHLIDVSRRAAVGDAAGSINTGPAMAAITPEADDNVLEIEPGNLQ